MSVTFDAKIDEKVDQDTLFTFSYNQIISDPDNKIKDFIDEKYDGDIDYYFYKDNERSGGKTLSEWKAIFSDFGDLTRSENIDDDEYNRFPSFTASNKSGGEIYFTLYPVYEKDKYSVQLSSGNARSLLQLLGLDSWGSMDKIAFLKRIESVKGSRIIDEFTRSPVNENRVYDRGIDRAYIERKLLELEALADYCIMKECDISWG